MFINAIDFLVFSLSLIMYKGGIALLRKLDLLAFPLYLDNFTHDWTMVNFHHMLFEKKIKHCNLLFVLFGQDFSLDSIS